MFSDNSTKNSLNMLDRVRMNDGIDKFRDSFHELVKNNRQAAIQAINHSSLHPYSLFLLQTEIRENGLESQLSTHNQNTLEIMNGLLKRDLNQTRFSSYRNNQEMHSILKWILSPENINVRHSDEQYDEIIDYAAILLTRMYQDQSVIPTIVDVIFNRYRQGLYIYDLVWAFYSSPNPQNLAYIANRFYSPHPKDVELAVKLLSFVPGIQFDNPKEKNYRVFHQWFRTNSPFIYFTGETFQQMNNPSPFKVSLEAKYLCKSVSVHTGSPLGPLTENENILSQRFNKLDNFDKMLLSNYSYQLYLQNQQQWSQWMNNSLDHQIRYAQAMGGGLV